MKGAYPLLHQAIRWASKKHKGADRDGESPLPYITHPIEVLINLRTLGGVTDEAMLCAAVLHDTLEETDARPEEIEQRFGPQVTHLVIELTREEPSEEEAAGLSRTALSRLRTEKLLREVEAMSPEAQIVKLADRLANLRDAPRTRSKERLTDYQAQTYRILERIPRDRSPELWDAIQDLLGPKQNHGP